MKKVEIMDLNVVCRSFPENLAHEVHRDHLLDTIDKIFEGETKLVFIEGKEGIGKTTLLAQYAKRHRYNSFSLFIKPTSRFACDPDYLRLVLSEQIYWAIHKKVLDSETIDESFLRINIPKLQERALRNRDIYYFIIDGLDEISNEDSLKDIVIKDMLPLGLKNFCFLLTGEIKQFSEIIPRSVYSIS